MLRVLSRFARSELGGVAVAFAIGLPTLCMLAVGVIELYTVARDNAQLQNAADAAALVGAKQLVFGETGVPERVAKFVASNLPQHLEPLITSRVEVLEGQRVHVRLSGRRSSFFANLLPPDGWRLNADATAASLNQAPLCVLVHGDAVNKAVRLRDTAQLQATNCAVHSNGQLLVEGVSWLKAAMVSSVQEATGRISPTPLVGAAVIPDPFNDLDLSPGACTDLDLEVVEKSVTLGPGVHCGKLKLDKGAKVTLLPGEHYFAGSDLEVSSDGELYGRDVVLILDKTSKLKFQDRARVDLEGRKTGSLAGFLIVTARGNTNDLKLWSDNVDNLLGVIYAPDAKLQVDGKDQMAEDSDWTVVVAKALELKGSARLRLNTNYSSSLVPVPEGVGNNGPVRLLR